MDGDGATTAQAFDLADQLTKVTDPDTNVTSYGLDGDGFATLVTNPNGHTTQQKFDGNGDITQQITPDGNTISYTYDGDGRITADGNGNRTYNADGLLATAYNANGTYVFSYDKDDRLTLVTEPYSQSLNYAYDLAGNQTQVIDSLGGTLASTYDSDNYLTRRTYTGLGPSERFDFTNNKEGWNTTLTSYSDLAGATLVATSKYGYDGAGNVTSVLSSDHTGATIDQFTYALDGNGNLTSETDTQAGTTTTTSYGYDSAGQITSAGTGTYGYLWKWQPQTDRNSDFCGSGPPRAGRHNRHFRGLLPGQRAQARSRWSSLLPAPPAGRYPTDAWRNGVQLCGDATGLGIARPTVYRWQPALVHWARAVAPLSVTRVMPQKIPPQDAASRGRMPGERPAPGTGPRGRWARTCGCFREST